MKKSNLDCIQNLILGQKPFKLFEEFFGKSKIHFVLEIFPLNIFPYIIFLISQNISFEAIQNGGKSNGVLLDWTEVTNKIYCVCDMQNNWNSHKNVYGEACFSKKESLQMG